MEKQEKKQRKLLTENRMATINKRETSFEGLVGQLENGEDGIYNLVANDKNIIFQPKVTITRKDLEEIPPLRELRDCIERWEKLQKQVSGRDAFIVKRTLIEMRKDQYIIKNCYRRPIVFQKLTRNIGHFTRLPWDEWIDENGKVCYSGVSFLDPDVVSVILCNFPKLKENSRDSFQGDTWYMVQDFEKLARKVLTKYPLYGRIVQYKLELRPNTEIKDLTFTGVNINLVNGTNVGTVIWNPTEIDISQFLKMIENKETHRYGKQLEMIHQMESFSPFSQKQIQFMKDI